MPSTDFDFLPGKWRIANRRLVDTLDPDCTEWEEFEASDEAELILGGIGNINRYHVEGDTSYEGFTLRLHDPSDDTWRIWWASTGRPGRLDPPVVGRFSDPRTARFECDDVLEGIPIRVRFDWSECSPDYARWEQAFSFDGGTTWKTNWIMLNTRVG
jgi:hypothetical protein